MTHLKHLAEKVETECEKLGFSTEKRAFKPHLTIGRITDAGSASKLAESHLAREFGPYRFVVPEIVIYKSELHRTGSVYSKLATFRFQG